MPWSARLVAALSMVVLAGCGSITGAATTGSPVRALSAAAVAGPGAEEGALASFYQTPVPLGPEPPGAIIRSAPIPSDGLLPHGALAYRVLYHSQSIAGADIAVSGVVVVPGGRPPPTGFPIVSWAHGTTGLADQCAPSLAGFTSIPMLDSLLDRHVIVAATDYEGLGTSGLHPYLIGQSEGQGVLDAARAARALVGARASNAVAVLGYSQGGQGALFASQIAPAYAPELFLAGAAAVSPVTSLSEFVPKVTGSGDDQAAVYAVMALAAWSGVYGNVALSSVLTPDVVRRIPAVTSECSGDLAPAYDSTATSRVFLPGWDLSPTLQADMAENTPGRSPTATPLLVVEGSEDTLTPYAAVTQFVGGALCHAEDDTVTYLPLAGVGHSGALEDAGPAILQWITARFAGARAVDSCARL